MSKTNYKVCRAPRRFFTGLLALFPALSACALVDQPDATKLFGNAYHDGGWISYGTDIYKENGYLQFSSGDDYVYSPRYTAPVRKIVMEARCSASSAPTRFLTVMPYVRGVEAPALVVTNTVYDGKDKLTVSSFDFSTSVGVDAFRLGMTGGSGNWGLTRLAVIYGAKTDDEDALLREFAQQLPVPEDLRLTHLESSSFEVSASPVADAVGYCFELMKLSGCPRTELREDFVDAPNLSNGWMCDVQTEGLTLLDGEKSYPDSSALDEHALKIEKGTNPKEGPVELGLLSPLSTEPISEWSFVGRVGTLDGRSNSFAVYGRTAAATTEWIELAKNLVPEKRQSNRTFKGAVDAALNIRQVRFVLTADAASWTTTGLDSLCVVYGGDETSELISAQTNVTPTAKWTGLESGRYGCRVKALGEREGEKQFKDSAWSELTVDLSWADVRLSPPENLAYEVSGDKLNLSWSPVAMADHYEVKVALASESDNPVVTLVSKSASATVAIAELGDYVVTVTAVSPGGVSTAKALLENCTVKLGKVTELAVEATAADTIAAAWKAVPLAESYQAKLFKLTGEYVRTEVESVGTKDCAATYRGLDKTAKYVVVVTPQPSEGTECEVSSVIVDLASVYFRPVGPISIAGCRRGVYLERFDALAGVTKETDLRRVPLENWQFFKGSGEAEKMFYTSGTNSTRGGVYCYSDAGRTTDSFMIGTVATSSMGSSVGLAFVNDTGSTLGAPTLTFTAVRRNEKPGDPYVLEWLVTDGPWSIGTESDDWQSLPVSEGVSEFSVKPDDCRIGPGQVIIFRWRHEKVSGGPMLGLDDVHVEFPVSKPGFSLRLR